MPKEKVSGSFPLLYSGKQSKYERPLKIPVFQNFYWGRKCEESHIMWKKRTSEILESKVWRNGFSDTLCELICSEFFTSFKFIFKVVELPAVLSTCQDPVLSLRALHWLFFLPRMPLSQSHISFSPFFISVLAQISSQRPCLVDHTIWFGVFIRALRHRIWDWTSFIHLLFVPASRM